MNRSFFQTLTNSEKAIMIFSTLAIFTSYSGIAIILPPILKIAAYYAFPHAAQLSISFFVLGLACSPLIIGAIVDFYDKRFVTNVVLWIYILSSALVIITTNKYEFLFCRFLQGSAASGLAIIGRAYTRYFFSGTNLLKITAYLSVMICISLTLTPMLGSIIDHMVGWRSIFIFLSCIGIFEIILLRYLPNFEPNQRQGAITDQYKHYKKIITNENFLVPSLIIALFFGAAIIYDSSGAIIFQKTYLVSPMFYSIIVATGLIAYAIGANLSTPLSLKINESTTFLFAIFLFFTNIFLFSLQFIVASPILLTMAILLFYLAYGLSFPIAMKQLIEPFKSDVASVTSLSITLQMAITGVFVFILTAFNNNLLLATFLFHLFIFFCFSLLKNKIKKLH